MDMKVLYQRRSAEFLKEIRPYLHYALQSVVMSAVAAFLLFSIAYRLFLGWVTPAFPWELLCATVMLFPLAGGKIRSYLQDADIIFLLPHERGMNIYLQAAMRKALIIQTAIVIAVWLLIWPLYAKMTAAGGLQFIVILLVLVLFKWALMFGKWTELQLQEPSIRRWFVLLRWLLAALSAYAMFAWKLPYGILLLAVGSILYLGLLRLPRKYIVHWLLLIDWEKRHRASVYRFLNWFIDVPQVQGKARNTRIPKGWLRIIPFRQSSSYLYMYTLIWLRSELLGITFRLTVLGIVILASLRSDWASVISYIAFGLFGALQLSDLKRYYRVHIWHRIYPLPDGLLKRSISTVRLLIHLAMLLLMAIPLGWTLSTPVWAAVLFLLSAAASWLFHRYK
ncbi:ABC transporter permease [Paenibacillus sp. UNC451MF]|uniref:ABC transporter permease n=1 Tax=Paenibacillus sp. UNC451MF TaxID=1449063 RepID=UPI00055E6EED|nr:ABC transporter permease [Paenibacillus sp. UNC451MF]